MNGIRFDKKLHMKRLPALRRGMAALLTLAMLCPMLPIGSLGVDLPVWPLQAEHTTYSVSGDTEIVCDSTDYPNVELESNFVRDEFGFLTGYMELGLRVQTPVGKTFQALEVTVEYDTKLLTAVDWTDESSEVVLGVNRPDGTAWPGAAAVHNYNYYSEQLPTQKLADISDATAHSGWPDTAATGVTTGVGDNSRALLSIVARSAVSTDNQKVSFPEMTTLAVVRFKVAPEVMEEITIVKDGKDPLTGKDLYAVRYHENPVSNIPQLQKEMNDLAAANAAAGSGGTTSGTTGSTGGSTGTTGGTTAATFEELVRFANDGDIDAANASRYYHAGMALHYQGGAETVTVNGKDSLYKVEYYYTDVATTSTVEEEYDGVTYHLKKPDTVDDTIPILAVDPRLPAGDAGPQKRYSYLTNLIYNELKDKSKPLGERCHINFTVASKRSFMDTKDLLGNVTIVTLLDWDNTTIGQLVVPKNRDVRGLISDYAAENLIYHDTDNNTVGANDINDPAAAAARDGVTAEDVVKSLDRIYNYRGKYSAIQPEPDNTDDATTVDYKDLQADGTKSPTSKLPFGREFPLTNKLDYVFYKRPMTHPDPKPDPDDPLYQVAGDPNQSGEKNPTYIADLAAWNASDDWIQVADNAAAGGGSSSGGVSAFYDLDHPYAYGWALCTQENYEDVWTTLGNKGELDNYEIDADGRGKVTYNGEADFQFADLEKGFTQDAVYLKAVYEPGTELVTLLATYRLTTQPAYNKLNGSEAELGGAYSVILDFERAKADDGDGSVRGVFRMREPYIRQQATIDFKWLENAAKNVKHDLPNPDTATAIAKTESTYTKVEAANSEVINVQLTLSARQNKIDYFLTDGYQSNFVTGGERTITNFDRSGADFLADNYNYYVDGDYDANYYGVPKFEDRNGSHGFVLYGTLNNMMQQATYYYDQGDAYRLTYNRYVSDGTMNDANLRADKAGATPDTDTNNMRLAIRDAAGEARTNHYGDPDYWDNTLDCAKLTYHQLQWYILDKVLLDPVTAEDADHKLAWCHLHDACAAASAGLPTDWPGLMELAFKGFKDDGGDPLDFPLIKGLDDIAYLRSDGNGTAFPDVATYQSTIETAVKALATTEAAAKALTWDQVQAQIVGDAASDAPDKYWWYDGTTSVSQTNWSELVTSAADGYDVTDNPLAPGEAEGAAIIRTAKFNQLETVFDENAAYTGTDPLNPDPDAVAYNWRAATENLCRTVGGKEGQKFADFASFRSAFLDALDRAKQAGVTSPTWYQVQYDILHSGEPGYTFPATPTTAQQEEFKTYWWHNGGQKVKNVATMLAAAAAKNAAWDAFTFTEMQDTANYPELYFAKDKKGTAYTAAEFDAFKTTIETLAAQSTNLTWNQVQYYLIYGNTTDVHINSEANYYWWKAGGDGTTITFDPVNADTPNKATVNSNTTKMIEAVFRAKEFGDPKALAGLASPSDIFANFRLAEGMLTTPVTALTDLKQYGSISDFADAMMDVINAAKIAQGYVDGGAPDTFNLPYLTWYQVQDYHLEGNRTYRADADIKADTNVDYWWYEKSSLFTDPAAELIENLEKTINGVLTSNQLKATLTLPKLNNTYQIRKNPAGANWVANPAAQNLNAAKTKIGNLATALASSSYYNATTQKLTFSWAQIQYWILYGALTDPTTAIQKLAWSSANGGLDWVTKGKIPSGVAVPPEPSGTAFSLRPMMARPNRPQVNVTTLEDGRVLTESIRKIYNAETELYDKEITREWVTREEADGKIKVTTRILKELITIDVDALEPVTKTLQDEEFVTWEDLPQAESGTYTTTADTTPTTSDSSGKTSVDNKTDSDTVGTVDPDGPSSSDVDGDEKADGDSTTYKNTADTAPVTNTTDDSGGNNGAPGGTTDQSDGTVTPDETTDQSPGETVGDGALTVPPDPDKSDGTDDPGGTTDPPTVDDADSDGDGNGGTTDESADSGGTGGYGGNSDDVGDGVLTVPPDPTPQNSEKKEADTVELTNLEKGVIALTENQLTHDGLLSENGTGAPGEAASSLDGERKNSGMSELSDVLQSESEGYGGNSDDVGRGALAGPTTPTNTQTIPLDDDDPGGGSEQLETFDNTQVQEVAK